MSRAFDFELQVLSSRQTWQWTIRFTHWKYAETHHNTSIFVQCLGHFVYPPAGWNQEDLSAGLQQRPISLPQADAPGTVN